MNLANPGHKSGRCIAIVCYNLDREPQGRANVLAALRAGPVGAAHCDTARLYVRLGQYSSPAGFIPGVDV